MARSLSTALLNLLSLPGAPSPSGAQAFTLADLYSVTLTGTRSDVARFTSWHSDVIFNDGGGAATYSAGAVIPTRNRVRSQLGLQVDQLSLEVGHGGTALFGSTSSTWAALALSGALDGAKVKLYRGFFDASGTFIDAVLLFGGQVGEIQVRSTVLALTVESAVALLRTKWPRNILTAGCAWNLYDAGCGLTRPATWDSKTTAAGSTASVVKIASFSDSTGFNLGTLTIVGPTTSALYGQTRTIVSSVNNGADHDVTVSPALPSAPAPGLTVRLTRGCDKTAATCETVFGNLKNYLGAPRVPPDSVTEGR